MKINYSAWQTENALLPAVVHPRCLRDNQQKKFLFSFFPWYDWRDRNTLCLAPIQKYRSIYLYPTVPYRVRKGIAGQVTILVTKLSYKFFVYADTHSCQDGDMILPHLTHGSSLCSNCASLRTRHVFLATEHKRWVS